MVRDDNMFVEAVLPGAVQRTLGADEMDHYRRRSAAPARTAGRRCRGRATSRSRVVAIVEEYGTWLSESDVPMQFVDADPGFVTRGRVRDFTRTRPNQTEVTVPGIHFLQEDNPDDIGRAVASFVRAIRPSDAGAMRS